MLNYFSVFRRQRLNYPVTLKTTARIGMDKNEKINELARRRGFLWPAFELYGGAAGFFDYGPLGAPLKRRIEDIWRQFFVIQEGFAEIEAPTIGVEEIGRAHV